MSVRKLAVFDIDGTVFRSSLAIELMEQLIKDGAVSHNARDIYEIARRKWVERDGPYEDFQNQVIEAALEFWRGVHYGDFADAAKVVIGAQSKHTYVYTRNLITDLKKQGYFLLAISHSPKTIVEPFCRKLGFDKSYGIVFEIGPQDRLTSNVVDDHLIWNKSNILKRVLNQESVSLVGSVGVGDTESDIPFLEMVETPICFNPNRKLYRTAKRMGWKVVVERKDVVYEL